MENLKVRASALKMFMTGFVSNEKLESIQEEIGCLIQEREEGISKNGNKVKWTETKIKRLAKLYEDLKPEKLLSETAKSYVREVAFSDFFGVYPQLEMKQLEKGIVTEEECIDLVNKVFFKDYKKNEERIDKEWLTGECDIIDFEDDLIIDVKAAWNFTTFPFLQQQVESKLSDVYEWQGRGYMYLYERNNFQLIYCLVDTPDELLNEWDDESIHKVSHIPFTSRVTPSRVIKRDESIERDMEIQYERANAYYHEVIAELESK